MHLILFDIDGTLIGGQGMGRLAIQRAFGEVFERDMAAYPKVADVHFAGSTDPVIFSDMARALDIPPDLLRERREILDQAYLRHLRVTVANAPGRHSCPGIPELLIRLQRHARITLGLVTGNAKAGARIKLEPSGLNRFFPFGGFGGDGKERKDLAARARERAREASGQEVHPANTLIVGDTDADIVAGNANGFLTVGVATGWGSIEAMQQAGATAIFDDLTPANGFETWLEATWDLAQETDPV